MTEANYLEQVVEDWESSGPGINCAEVAPGECSIIGIPVAYLGDGIYEIGV